MPDDPRSNLPVPPSSGGSSRALDRSAVERVLARAAELQQQTLSGDEPAEALSEEQLVELGREVGLSAEHMRQALAEERTRVAVPPESGVASAVVGPAAAAASRTVRGNVPTVLAALDAWMVREECLRVKRRFPDRIVWEAGGGIMRDIGRWLNLGGRGYHLRRAVEVSATVVAVDAQRVLVRLDADLRGARSESVGNSVISLTAGTAIGVTAAVMGVLVPVAVLPAVAIGAGGTWAARHSYRRALSLAQLSLEQILDRLEHGEIRVATPGALLDVALGALTKKR